MNLKLKTEKDGVKIYDFKLERPLTAEEKKAIGIFNILKKAGFETYFAGGAVRDELLGIPAHDIDIVTAAKPEEVQQLFPQSYDRGKKFGVMAINDKHDEFEIATFRVDLGIADHRRPATVKFSTVAEDARRRDFTVNGLFFEPEKEQIIDYVGGVEDLKNKKLNFIGDPAARIEEDYLRMLRAARFSARFGFPIEEKGKAAIKKKAKKILSVSKERIRDELSKILINENRVTGIKMLDELDLLEFILPELVVLKNVEQPIEFHSEGDVWQHTLLALESLDKKAEEKLVWTVLLHDIAKPETQGFRDHPKSKITFFEHDVESADKARKILERFKFSNEFIESVAWAIGQHMRIVHAFRGMSDRKKEKLFLDPNIDLLLEHTKADLSASIPKGGKADLTMYHQAVKLRDELGKKINEQEKKQIKKFSLITGLDIINILGIKPGPKVGKIKNTIEQAYLDGQISRRDEALKMIDRFRSPSSSESKESK